MTLDHEDIDEIARRVAELLRDALGTTAVRLVDAATVADILGVERDWVYAHAQDLGAVRLGGPRGRVRFDLRAIERAIKPPDPSPARAPRPAGAEGSSGDDRVPLLPYVDVASNDRGDPSPT